MDDRGCATHGATMIIPAPGFEPALTLKAVQDERCTRRLRPVQPPDGNHGWLTVPGGGDEARRDRDGMAEITICYGMTWTSPVSTQTGAVDDLYRRTSTVGRVHPHLEVKIVDPSTGLTVPCGLLEGAGATAQVTGVPDEPYGEELMAWLRLHPGAEALTAERVRKFCAGRIANYKIPRYGTR